MDNHRIRRKHGLAVASAGWLTKVPTRIHFSITAPPKIEKLRKRDAEVVIDGSVAQARPSVNWQPFEAPKPSWRLAPALSRWSLQATVGSGNRKSRIS